MKVLVLGAAGFIGFPAAQAFVRAGHEVYGQTRNGEKARLFEAEEIIPVIANPANADEWSAVAEKVDIVIDCIGGNEISTLSEAVFATAVNAAKRARGALKPKLTYIYCGGTWVHGEDRNEMASERSPPKNTTPLVAWRVEREQRVLAEPTVDGIVVRPALLYGRSGSITALLFTEAAKAASEGREIAWPGRAGGRWAFVHCDDLAELFLRVAEAAPVCKGLIIDAANEHSESVNDVLETLTHISGAPGWHYRQPANAFEEAVAVTTLLRPSLARALVGWQPRKASFTDGLKTYYAAFKAESS